MQMFSMLRTFLLQFGHIFTKKNAVHPKMNSIFRRGRAILAGVAGFEPTNTGIKIRCLTAWRYPIVIVGREMGIEPTTSRTTIWRSTD